MERDINLSDSVTSGESFPPHFLTPPNTSQVNQRVGQIIPPTAGQLLRSGQILTDTEYNMEKPPTAIRLFNIYMSMSMRDCVLSGFQKDPTFLKGL